MHSSLVRLSSGLRKRSRPSLCNHASDILMPAPVKSGKQVGIVLVPGMSFESAAYRPLLAAMQQKASIHGISLFAACMNFDLRSAPLRQPYDLKDRFDTLTASMHGHGLVPQAPIFHGAHGLAAVFLQDYLHGRDESAGQLLFGATILRKHCYPAFSYRLPTLTIGAQLDGVEPIGRMAEQHSIHQQLDQSKFPVVVLEGQNHMQFASGRPPHGMQQELPAAVGHQAAHETIGDVSVDFMRVQLGIHTAGKELQKQLRKTEQLVLPILMSQQLMAQAGAGPQHLLGFNRHSTSSYEPDLSFHMA